MKGKQLTLDEVLRLEDGTKVWAEELDENYKHWSQIYTKSDDRILDKVGGFYYLYELFEDDDMGIYEWIEEEYSNPMMLFEEDDCNYNINSMATEICNLRGINLTDDNIDKIMKEFEVK